MSDLLPIFDGHNDALLRLYREGEDGVRLFLEGDEDGHLDLPRAREAGMVGGFFAIFVPNDPDSEEPLDDPVLITEMGYVERLADPIDPDYAQETAWAIAEGLFRLEEESDGQVEVIRSASELTACLSAGRFAIVWHLEGAEPIDPELEALYAFHEAGVRSLGLVWSRPNLFGEGVQFAFPASPDTGAGLTEAGRDLVRACNQLGILVDLAHITERGFWEVAALTDAPLVVTHAGVHALCPSTRNLTDRQLDAIGESGGVVGVNFQVSDLRADGELDEDTSLTEIVRHIAYIAERIGVEHVALGSDFDGATIPLEMGDVTGLPVLVDTLRAYGFSPDELRRITHQNWLRVLGETLHG